MEINKRLFLPILAFESFLQNAAFLTLWLVVESYTISQGILVT